MGGIYPKYPKIIKNASNFHYFFKSFFPPIVFIIDILCIPVFYDLIATDK